MYRRVLVAVCFGISLTLVSYIWLRYLNTQANDFTWVWRGARLLLAGQNPYLDPAIGAGHPYPADAPLYYPLPALLLGALFAPFPVMIAGALFFGLSTGLLVFAMTGDGYARLPMLLSLPFWYAFARTQWSPLLAAAVLVSPLLPLAMVKPSVGLAALVSRPTRRGLIMCASVVGISLIILPSWPLDWYRGLGQHQGRIPLLMFPGPILLLALLAFRDWRARTLLALALAPQLLYDSVPLGLIPRTLRESIAWALLSWLTLFGLLLAPSLGIVWQISACYIPALVMVLRHTVVPSLRQRLALRTSST